MRACTRNPAPHGPACTSPRGPGPARASRSAPARLPGTDRTGVRPDPLGPASSTSTTTSSPVARTVARRGSHRSGAGRGEGLLQDPVRGQVDAGEGGRTRRPPPQVDVEPDPTELDTRRSASRSRGLGVRAGGPGGSGASVPPRAQHAAQVRERRATHPLDRAQALRRPASAGSWASPASAWTTMMLTLCATTSCTSRAMRARCSATRARAGASRPSPSSADWSASRRTRLLAGPGHPSGDPQPTDEHDDEVEVVERVAGAPPRCCTPSPARTPASRRPHGAAVRARPTSSRRRGARGRTRSRRWTPLNVDGERRSRAGRAGRTPAGTGAGRGAAGRRPRRRPAWRRSGPRSAHRASRRWRPRRGAPPARGPPGPRAGAGGSPPARLRASPHGTAWGRRGIACTRTGGHRGSSRRRTATSRPADDRDVDGRLLTSWPPDSLEVAP